MEEQLDFFEEPKLDIGEIAIAFQTQLMDLTTVVARQQEVMQDMAVLLKKQQDELQMLVGDKYRNEPKLYQLEQQMQRVDMERHIRDDVNQCTMDINRATQEMYNSFQREKNSRLTLQTTVMIEVFKLFLETLPDSQKAEIISKMAGSASQIMMNPIFGIGTNFGISELLKEAASILDQPDAILTLYK